jgi:hypothetical protein
MPLSHGESGIYCDFAEGPEGRGPTVRRQWNCGIVSQMLGGLPHQGPGVVVPEAEPWDAITEVPRGPGDPGPGLASVLRQPMPTPRML